MLERTSTADAPWRMIPADRKRFRDRLVSEIIVDVLAGLDMRFPPDPDELDGVVVE